MEIQELRQKDRPDRSGDRKAVRQTDGNRAGHRAERQLPVLDSERERALLNKVAAQAGAEYEQGIRELYQLMMKQSRNLQEQDGTFKSSLHFVEPAAARTVKNFLLHRLICL